MRHESVKWINRSQE